MIAAAAADGRIDDAERQKIMSGLDQAGLDAEARQFLAGEFENPATIDDLAEASSSPEEAVKIYTAARIAVDIDTDAEHAFLAALADRLGIDDDLVVHIYDARTGLTTNAQRSWTSAITFHDHAFGFTTDEPSSAADLNGDGFTESCAWPKARAFNGLDRFLIQAERPVE